MSSNNFKTNVLKPAQQLGALTTYRRLRAMLRNAKLFCVGMLTLLVVSLTGCACQPTQPSDPLPLPKMPQLTEPLPSVNYSISVGARIKSWGLSLTDTSQTSKP